MNFETKKTEDSKNLQQSAKNLQQSAKKEQIKSLTIKRTVNPSDKLVTLLKFIQDNKHWAAQGTDQWRADRMYCIGGSEISTVMGINPFDKKVDIIARKLALTHFSGNSATRWGNLFEGVSERLFKILFLFGGDIYNIGSIPHKTINEHRYSPDGLCIMQINNQEKIVLLEFKSPYSSVPTSKVPKHYLPQVKAGLCTIDIADTCVFVNNMFRKCALSQLDFSIDYDDQYHRDTDAKFNGINAAIVNGIIFLYVDKYKITEFNKQYNEFIRIVSNCNSGSDNSNNEYDSDNSDSEDNYIVYNSYNYNSNDSDRDSNIDPVFDNDLERNIYYEQSSKEEQLFYKIYPSLYTFNNTNTTDNKYKTYKENMIDFGDKQELFDQMLKLYKTDDAVSIISPKYMKPSISTAARQDLKSTFVISQELEHMMTKNHFDNICKQYDAQTYIDKFIKQCVKNDNIPIGYLPWKLFRSSNIIVDKDPCFLDAIKEDITSTIEVTKTILANATTNYEKAVLLNTYFEDNYISKKYINAARGYSFYTIV